jgi:hypothetical protein
MKKAGFVILLLTTITCFSQSERKLSTFASLQYNHTLYDQKFLYKTGIAGLGLQVFSNNNSKFRPTLEINTDLVTRLGIGPADESVKEKSIIPSVYIGPSVHPTDRFFIAATVGPTLYCYYKKVQVGVRSSAGFYPCRNNRWFAKASYTNVLQEPKFQNNDFGYLSFALALKL